MTQFRDFDEFRREAAGKGPSFKLYDEVVQLPPSLPMRLMLDAAQLQAAQEANTDVTPDEIKRLAYGIFTKERVEAWADEGMDVDLLTELIAWIPAAYDEEVEVQDGDADPGN